MLITDGKKRTKFNAVVNYDPQTNALEVSFLARISLAQPLTGLVSLSGPENNNREVMPYMEDVLVVREAEILKATEGSRVEAKHLLSVHGVTNLLKAEEQPVWYAPAPTLIPIVDQVKGAYSLEERLKTVLSEMG